GKRVSRRETATDAKGQFRLRVPLHSTIKVSLVGYEAYTYKATEANQNINIDLIKVRNELEETIVMGYTTKSQASVTSSVVVIDADDLVQTPAANVMELLQGRVAGMNIQLNNGTPGMQGTYTIRGISDIAINGSGEN